MNEQKKITRATLKSFIRKNRDRLLIKTTSRFDGQTDGVEPVPNAKFVPAESTIFDPSYTCGISGVWLCSGSRNSFSHFEDEAHTGIRVYNSCGSFVLAVRKEGAK